MENQSPQQENDASEKNLFLFQELKMSLQYREGPVCQSVDLGWKAQGPLVQAKILHLQPRLHTPSQDGTAPDFKGLALQEIPLSPSIGLNLFWAFHLAVIPSSHSLENSESHTLLGRIKSHLAFSAPPPSSPLGSRSHLQEPESGGLHPKLRSSHCAHLQLPPPHSTLCSCPRDSMSLSSEFRSTRSPC